MIAPLPYKGSKDNTMNKTTEVSDAETFIKELKKSCLDGSEFAKKYQGLRTQIFYNQEFGQENLERFEYYDSKCKEFADDYNLSKLPKIPAKQQSRGK